MAAVRSSLTPSPPYGPSPAQGGGRPGLALLDEDYFDGPGEELWSPLAIGDQPDGWWDARGADEPDGQPWRAPDGTPGEDLPGADAGGGFGPGGPVETMTPGLPLHMLVEQAVAGGLTGMPDDAVVGVVAAARRLRSRAEWLELKATEEFARRRWESGPVPERDKDGRWRFKGRDAEFAADELAFHLVDSPLAAQERMDLSLTLRDRLPAMAAQLAAGRGDAYRCQVVHDVTGGLSDEHASRVDAEMAPEAPGLRYDALRRRARKLAMMLDPDSERERKERATRKQARVEVFPEKSGNYALAGRELPIEDVLASRAHLRGLAQELLANGVRGSLRELELACYLDLTQGRDPRDRILGRNVSGEPDAPAHAGPEGVPGGGPAGEGGGDTSRDEQSAGDVGRHQDEWGEPGLGGDGRGDGRPEREAAGREHRDWRGDPRHEDGDDQGDDEPDRGGGGGGSWPFSPPGTGGPGGRAPFPAKISLLVPIGTLLGWSSMPGEAGRDIIDPQTLRDLVQASSHHPATRWGVTIIGQDKTATAHGYARGQHPWDPPPDQVGSAHASRARDATPTAAQREQVGQLLDELNATFEPIAKGLCDHRHREDRYRPGRELQDLVRARNATCPAPGCGAASSCCDLDHTQAWPRGDTDECNLGPPCRHHHRLKQASGWELTQLEPGFFRWKAPSGRLYCTGPTRYDV